MEMRYVPEEEINDYPESIREMLQMGVSLDAAYSSLLSNYIRISVPDKALLAEYVKRAKGPERSLRQFAEEIDVNVSTLSRIINQKISGTNSERLIAKIAAHADKNCGVTFEMFMVALGMASDEASVDETTKHNIRVAVKDRIFEELLRRQYSVALLQNEPIETLAGKFKFDFAIETNAWGEFGNWGFVIETDYCTTIKQTDEEFDVNVKRVMRKISYLSSLYETFGFNYDRVTMIMVDEDLFYTVQNELEKMRNLYLNHEVSLILMDKETELVMQEYIIQWMKPDGMKERNSVFTIVDGDEEELEILNNAWNSKYDE